MLLTPQSVYIIAEAGVNHDGSEERARELVDIAVSGGADAVKFQLFSPEALVTHSAPTASYQAQNLQDHDVSQRAMLEKLTLPQDAYGRLDAYCRKQGIDFLCTPFDSESLNYLESKTRMPYLKLPSGEVVNGPFLLEAARTGMSIILSTGMATLDEIGVALSILHFGYANAFGHPERLEVPTPDMLPALREKVTLLHCVSQYPAPVHATNLLAMDTLAETFGLPVGLSDHSEGLTIAIAAAARGAAIIEKHFTYDTNALGPTTPRLYRPQDLKEMVLAIRDVSEAMGNGEKSCQPEEENTRAVARRSVVAAMNIAKGARFSEENLTCKRPATGGIAPNRFWNLLGKTAMHAYAADDFIDAAELER